MSVMTNVIFLRRDTLNIATAIWCNVIPSFSALANVLILSVGSQPRSLPLNHMLRGPQRNVPQKRRSNSRWSSTIPTSRNPCIAIMIFSK
jgi:hypothetical protein